MNKQVQKLFANECLKNRNYLEYSVDDIVACLNDVSEEEYLKFEKGEYELSIDNMKRLVKVLCLDKPKKFNLKDYIDVSNLDNEEIADLSNIVKEIVGDSND